jgi:predicted deacylase
MENYPIELAVPDITPFAAGNCGTPYLYEFRSEKAGPTVMICALTHGNEFSGAIVVCELLRMGFRPACGTLILSFNNVAAYEKFDRLNPDISRYVDEDFNRLWSDKTLLSSRVTVELTRARQIKPFVDRADFLLDLHSMHEKAPPMLVCGWLNKGVELAKSLKAVDYLMMDRGHELGVRLRDYGEFADENSSKNAMLLEAGQHWEANSLETAKNIVARFLSHLGLLGDSSPIESWVQSAPSGAPSILEVTHAVIPKSDAFTFGQNFKGCERLRLGELIGQEEFDGESREIRAPYDDCVLVMPSLRHAKPGVTVVRLAKDVGLIE